MNQKLSYNLAFRKFYDSAFDVCVALSCVVCMQKKSLWNKSPTRGQRPPKGKRINPQTLHHMTRTEALEQLQAYCRANGLALSPGNIGRPTYAFILAEGDEGEITTRYPHERISGYFTPKELLYVWLDGYHRGISKQH